MTTGATAMPESTSEKLAVLCRIYLCKIYVSCLFVAMQSINISRQLRPSSQLRSILFSKATRAKIAAIQERLARSNAASKPPALDVPG